MCSGIDLDVFDGNPHKKESRDLTDKQQDLTEMSLILMVLTKI